MDINFYIEQSMEGLRMQTASHDSAWGIGGAQEWAVDQGSGLLSFSFADGKLVVAPVQIIGTYNPEDSSFLWAWDHPSVQEPLQEHARLAKAFGEEHGLENFINQKVICTEDQAWELTSVAARLAEANGAYRGGEGPIVYMTFGTVQVSMEAAETTEGEPLERS